jgi:hypothetical protein
MRHVPWMPTCAFGGAACRGVNPGALCLLAPPFPAHSSPRLPPRVCRLQHLLPIPELAARLGTQLDSEAPNKSRGLSEKDAADRLLTYGRNQLSPPKQRPLWLQFLLKARHAPLLRHGHGDTRQGAWARQGVD